jgi:hypothetical protein
MGKREVSEAQLVGPRKDITKPTFCHWAGPISHLAIAYPPLARSVARGHGETPRGAAAPPPPPAPAAPALADLALRLPAPRLRRAPPPLLPAPGRAGRPIPPGPGPAPPGPFRDPSFSILVTGSLLLLVEVSLRELVR